MIFADPAVQAVYDTIVLGNIPGDCAAGIKAYATGKSRDYFPLGVKTPDELAVRYNAFIDGYESAAKDPRYQVLFNLARSFR